MSGDLISMAISMWEGNNSGTGPDNKDMTGVGAVMLCCSTLGICERGLLWKESVEEAHWRVGDIEEEGGMVIRTPTPTT